MARIRTIKPEFFESEQIGNVSIAARLLFIGIWNHADDRGVIQDRPKQIKGQIFRYDDITVGEVEELIHSLVAADLLRSFVADGKTWLFVPTWEKHQKIDRPQRTFVNPAPPKIDEPSTNARRGLDERSTRARDGVESKGVESKGREGSRRESRGKAREGKTRASGGNGHAADPPLSNGSRVGRALPPSRLQEITPAVLAKFGGTRGFELLAGFEAGDPDAIAEIEQALGKGQA